MTRMSLQRTATVAWSPALPNQPHFPQFIATGSVAGALDASFSSQSELEIFSVPFNNATDPHLKKAGGILSTARFNRLAWSGVTSEVAPNGVLAAGLENGELALYNPHALINPDPAATATPADPILFRSQSHSTSVRGLDFNPIQSNLLGTGAGEGEILIWDMNNPTTPYSPGATKSPRLAGSEINALAWNRCVPHILATSSSNGVTVVWDLKNRREVFSLNAPTSQSSGAMWNGGAGAGASGMGAGTRRQGVVVAWHPDVPTQFVTALEDDSNPALYLWDLRNAHAPLRVFTGHSKGVLSVAWCPKDSDLLLSCGKDNRTLCWNPATGDILGELPHADNWCFDVQWCSRNPDWLSVASFDGSITVQSLLPSNVAVPSSPKASAAGPDPFEMIASSQQSHSAISLKQPPKWLRRPCTVAFAWGNRLVHVSSASRTVRVHPIISPAAKSAQQLIAAIHSGTLADLTQSRIDSQDKDDDRVKSTWLVLHSLFDGTAGRKLLVEHLDASLARSPAVFPEPSPASVTEANGIATPDNLTLVQHIVRGDYKSQSPAAVTQGRFADALVLAACGSNDLFTETRDTYLERHGSALNQLVASITKGNWATVVESNTLDWRQALMAILTYVQGDELTSQVAKLGDRLEASTDGVHDHALGVLMCNLLAGRVDRLVHGWIRQVHSTHVTSAIQQQAMNWGEKCLERASTLHQMVEQSSVLLYALNGSLSTDQVPKELQLVLAEYSFTMALHGAISAAWTYASLISDADADGGSTSTIALLKDRIARALNRSEQPAAIPPQPFSVVEVPLLQVAPAPVVAASGVPQQTQNFASPGSRSLGPAVSGAYGTTPGNPYGNQVTSNPYASTANNYPYAPNNGPATPSYNAIPTPPAPNTTSAPGFGPSTSSVPQYTPYQPRPSSTAPVPNFVVPNPLGTMNSMQSSLPSQTVPATPPPAASKAQGGWNDAPPMAPVTQRPVPPVAKAPTPQPMNPYASQPHQLPQSISPQQPQQQQLYGAPSYASNSMSQSQPTPIQPSVVSSAPLPPPPITAPPPPANVFQGNVGTSAPRPGSVHPPASTIPPPGMAPNAFAPPAPAPLGIPAPAVGSATGSSPTTTTAPPAAAPTHPPGDRSHIPQDIQPLAQSLMRAQAYIKQVHGASAQRRVAEDVDRRLNQLLDALNNNAVEANVVAALQRFVQAIDGRDWSMASHVHQELAMTSFDPWMLGLKRLVDLLARS
ncbi:hypothetical protein BCR44DRAFT_1482360 [Catenaria anguillulae PL171]|uniref:Protein transport protein SEC31 n=1 Tax=Catenaria anguillulae PL171 TaxID=765915 RepID=A0A1Y2I331_9FUNG|nr:hypothetical protein BCR44DRAFT_1482360 [Catenaria anguillulae PL171]